jgi:hypothetical protein
VAPSAAKRDHSLWGHALTICGPAAESMAQLCRKTALQFSDGLGAGTNSLGSLWAFCWFPLALARSGGSEVCAERPCGTGARIVPRGAAAEKPLGAAVHNGQPNSPNRIGRMICSGRRLFGCGGGWSPHKSRIPGAADGYGSANRKHEGCLAGWYRRHRMFLPRRE